MLCRTVFLLPEALDIDPALHEFCSSFLPSKNELLSQYQPLIYVDVFLSDKLNLSTKDFYCFEGFLQITNILAIIMLDDNITFFCALSTNS